MLLSELPLLPVNLIQLFTAFISILGVALLCGQKRYHGLVLALLVQASLAVFNLLEELNISRDLLFITPAFSLAVGPALYLMIRVLLNPQQPLKPSDIRHFAPALIALPFTHYLSLVHGAGAVSQLVYLGFALRYLKRYHAAINERRSDTHHVALNWLMGLMLLFMLLVIVEITRANLQPVVPYAVINHWYLLDQTILFLLTTALLIGLIRQDEIFTGLSEYEQTEQQTSDSKDDNAESIFALINQTILRQALYQQPRLSLQDVADNVGLNIKDISWAINRGSGRSFADYINQLRIEHVIRSAANEPNRNLLDLAFDAGFSSKSSFNAVFKKHTGSTPSQYIKRPQS